MISIALFDPGFSGRLCLTLLHSLWQVTLLATVVWGLERLLRRSVQRSYALHVLALTAGLAALPITYLLVDGPAVETEVSASFPADRSGPRTETIGPLLAATDAHAADPKSAAEETEPITESVGESAVIPHAAATGPQHTTAEASVPWMTLAPWIVLAYAGGVFVMLGRLSAGIWSAKRLVWRSQVITDGPLVERFQALVSRWSLHIQPALARVEQITVPKVVGLVRPTILLPSAAVTGLSLEQLELILAHELTHLRRHDLWVNLLQRVAEAILFFNPGLWYLSRRISTLREYCCDQTTCRTMAETEAEPHIRYAAALLQIAELSQGSRNHARNRRSPDPSELATLAASGHSPSELRRRVAHLFGEPIREPLRVSRGGLTAILSGVALAVGLLVWETQAQPPADRADAQTAADADRDDTPREFRLNVVGPDGRPVQNARVDIRTRPKATAEQIRRGTFVRQHNYGSYATTDDDGRLTVTLPQQPNRFSVGITEAGYGPYWAGWDSGHHPQALPEEFTARLDPGWSVGGVVVDENGDPVEGVRVKPSIEYKKRPGDTGQLGIGTRIRTDANGTWRFDSVPVSMSDIHVEVSHQDFQPLRRRLPRDGFEVKSGTQLEARIELNRGLTVTGQVTDESGAPIVGALVRTKFQNVIREAKTNEEGVYRLSGCEPRMARIVVSATGRATDMQEVRVDPDMEAVNFAMQPGGTVHIRVVDEQGNGIPKARIFFQRWRGEMFDYFEFDHVDQYADENGVWEWNEAPLDEFKADICRPGGMQLTKQSLIARDEEYVFTPPRALVVSGSVVDVKTKEPMKTFRVIPGLRNIDPTLGFDWIPGDSYEATDGSYRIRFTRSNPAHVVRIEADGYKVAISRDFKMDEGEVGFDFELTPAEDIAATILNATGEPAAHAKIALGVPGDQINIQSGDIDDGSTYATRLDADENGRFTLPARDEPFQLVITHPSGSAHVKSDDGTVPNPITLTSWARVEGTFRVGAQPARNVELSMFAEGIHSYGDDVPNIFTHHRVTTGENGRFAFERVFPGKGRIGRHILLMVDDGATEVTSSVRVSAEFIAGETTTLDLGGTGRPVVGKLAPPPGRAGKVLWNFALIKVRPDLTPPQSPTAPADVQNDPQKRKAWWEAWQATDEGQAWKSAYQTYEQLKEAAPYVTATVDRDGSFRIDDLPEGVYLLSVRFNKNSAGTLSRHFFLVPTADIQRPAEPFDLGTLTLERR